MILNKCIINILIIVACLMVMFSCFSISNIYSADFSYKIEVDDAKITSCPLDIGSIADCFDGSPKTLARTVDVLPAWIQVEFPQKKPVRSMKISLGQPGYFDEHYNWYLEAADTQSDLDNKTGTYELIVPETPYSIGKEFIEHDFGRNRIKKIWKFYAKKTWGDNHVHIPELEFYSNYSGSNINLKNMMDDGFIKAYGEGSYEKNLTNVIDGDPVTYLESSTGNSMSFILGFASQKIKINQIKVLAGIKGDNAETDKVTIEAAEKLEDFDTKSGSYKLVFNEDKKFKYDDWKYLDLFEQPNKKYWKFNVSRLDSNSSAHISELEFWVDHYYDGDPTIPKNLKLSNCIDKRVELTWNKVEHITGFISYNIFRNNVLIARTTEEKFVDSIPVYGYYVYNISASNPMGVTSQKSDSLELMITQNGGIDKREVVASDPKANKDGEIASISPVVSISPTITVVLSPSQTPQAGGIIKQNNKPEINKPEINKPDSNDNHIGDDSEPKDSNKINNVNSEMRNKIIVFSIILFAVILFFAINKIILVRKRLRIEKKKRDLEMQGIKKLIQEEKTDHLIELFNKPKK